MARTGEVPTPLGLQKPLFHPTGQGVQMTSRVVTQNSTVTRNRNEAGLSRCFYQSIKEGPVTGHNGVVADAKEGTYWAPFVMYVFFL